MENKIYKTTIFLSSIVFIYWILGIALLVFSLITGRSSLPFIDNDYFDDHTILLVFVYSFIPAILALIGLLISKKRKVFFLLLLILTLMLTPVLTVLIDSVCNERVDCGSNFTTSGFFRL